MPPACQTPARCQAPPARADRHATRPRGRATSRASRVVRVVRVVRPAALGSLVLGALLVWGAGAASAGGANTIGYNARSVGRGGADTAVGADGPSAAIRNPALLLGSYGLQVDASLGFLVSRTRFTNPSNDNLDTSGPRVAPSFGLAWDPLAPSDEELKANPSLPLDSSFRLGLVGYPIIGGGGQSDIKTTVYPEGETEALDFFVYAIGPVFAFNITETLTLGFSPQLLVLRLSTEGLVGSTSGFSHGRVSRYRDGAGNPLAQPEPFLVSGQQVTWGEVFDLAGTDDASASTRTDVVDVYGVGFTANLGLWWTPSPRFSLGLAYQPEGIIPTASGKAKLDANRAISNVQPAVEAVLGSILETFLPDGGQNGFQGNYDIKIKGWRTPAVLSLGLAARPLDRWLIALDLRYTFWKQAFNQLEVTMSGGTSSDINEINAGPTIHSTTKQKWRNSLGVALGSSVSVTDWLALRLGYSYSQNPITAAHGSPTSGITEHGVGFGVGVFLEQWELDFAYFHTFATGDRIEKSLDLAEWDNTVFKTEQHWFYLGASYQF